MTLAALQQDFTTFLRDGNAAVGQHVSAQGQRGLAVYHYAFRANLTSCLRGTFEKTHAWLGDGAFGAAAATHIASHAPLSWTLAAYGEGFDRTLAALYPNDPEVSELAWLDWSLRRAFDGPDAGALDRQSLGNVDWDLAILSFAPTLADRAITSNVAEIWNAMALGEKPPAARWLDQPTALIVWREGLSPRFKAIAEVERTAVSLARSGVAFGALCADIARFFPDEETAANFAGAMLGRWIGEGLLVAVR